MFRLALPFVALAFVSVHASPILDKRIAQTIINAVTPWETACKNANGNLQCNALAVNVSNSLLAAAGPCDQQNGADQFVDLGKKLNSNAMIEAAIIFVQQPRNSPNSLAIPYCQQPSKNAELNGLFQCQFAGSNQTAFVGGITVGAAGTIPLGQNGPVSPAGSCHAHSSGPVPDGQQLSDIVGGSGASPPAGSSSSATTTSSTPDPTESDSCPAPDPTSAPDSTSTPASTPTPASALAANPAPPPSASGAPSFTLANGKAAQKLNAGFASLTMQSSCTTNEGACVGGAFAQCVGGHFVSTACPPTQSCFALPLVNSPGTTITCDTESNAVARIANTGATGGVTG